MTSATEFESNLNTTQQDLSAINSDIMTLDSEVQTAERYLNYPKEVSDDLTELDNDLGTALDIMLVLEAVPGLDLGIPELRATVQELKNAVHPIRIEANHFENILKPYQNALQSFDRKLQTASRFVAQAKSDVQAFDIKFTTVNQCINAQPPSSAKTAAQSAVGHFVSAANPLVVKANNAMASALDSAQQVQGILQNIENEMKSLVPVTQAINDVFAELKPLLAGLQEIQSALNHEITVTYGIKVKGPWDEPWKWHIKNTNFTFSVEEIFKGVNGVIKPVMDLLEKAANAFIDPILKSVHLNFNIKNIPGLSQVEQVANAVEAKLDSIANAMPQLSNLLNELSPVLTSLQNEIAKFAVQCPGKA